MIIKKSKKGVSIMIGYILLISLAVVMGGIVYNWARTYIPQEGVACDDGVSLFMKKIECYKDETNLTLNILLRNNGNFNVGGFLLHGSNDSEKTVLTTDLTGNLSSGEKFIISHSWLQPGVKFSGDINSLTPGDEQYVNFSIPLTYVSDLEIIEVTPMRWQEIDGREKILTCGNSKIKEIINCND